MWINSADNSAETDCVFLLIVCGQAGQIRFSHNMESRRYFVFCAVRLFGLLYFCLGYLFVPYSVDCKIFILDIIVL